MFRIAGIQSKLSDINLDALFISNQYNVAYLTGFQGLAPQEREGFLFVTVKNAYLLLFPTYFGLYKDGGTDFRSLCISAQVRLNDLIRDIMKQEGLKTIGFEPENLTVSERQSLEQKLSMELTPTQSLVENLRIIKDDHELECIRESASVTDEAFECIKSKIAAGVTERDLAFELEFFIKKHADDIAFPPIVAFDKNAAIPHYLPDNKEHLTENNLILLDFGSKVNGYCSDMTRVVFMGTPSSEITQVYETVLSAQNGALIAIKPGVRTKDIDTFARGYITSHGYPAYPHGLGHGVGLAIHEAPRLKQDSTEILSENMVITVEPGIYLEESCGVRIEDLVVLTHSGTELLSKSPKELTVL